jgi:hypothetical protein
MKSKSKLVTINEVHDHEPEPAPAGTLTELMSSCGIDRAALDVQVEPEPGVLTSLLDFVLPTEAQKHGARMGRNPKHDLVCVAEHIVAARNQLQSVAVDAVAANDKPAVAFLHGLIERLS